MRHARWPTILISLLLIACAAAVTQTYVAVQTSWLSTLGLADPSVPPWVATGRGHWEQATFAGWWCGLVISASLTFSLVWVFGIFLRDVRASTRLGQLRSSWQNASDARTMIESRAVPARRRLEYFLTVANKLAFVGLVGLLIAVSSIVAQLPRLHPTQIAASISAGLSVGLCSCVVGLIAMGTLRLYTAWVHTLLQSMVAQEVALAFSTMASEVPARVDASQDYARYEEALRAFTAVLKDDRALLKTVSTSTADLQLEMKKVAASVSSVASASQVELLAAQAALDMATRTLEDVRKKFYETYDRASTSFELGIQSLLEANERGTKRLHDAQTRATDDLRQRTADTMKQLQQVVRQVVALQAAQESLAEQRQRRAGKGHAEAESHVASIEPVEKRQQALLVS